MLDDGKPPLTPFASPPPSISYLQINTREI